MNPDNLIVITSFPEKGLVHGKAVVGIASYAKNTLLAIKECKPETQITVLAEVLISEETSYDDGGISVRRIWQRNSFAAFFKLFKNLVALKAKHIVIEFEVSMFGDFIYLLPFPIFLLILKILGKNVTIVSHQVISDINTLSGHINLNGKAKTRVLNFFIHVFYRIILTLSTKVIVFDEVLKERLGNFGFKNKIIVIPHGVEEFKLNFTKEEARKKLGLGNNDFILLYFGYLAWYKGTDVLTKYFGELNNKQGLKLIIAGGPNPNHVGKKFYQDYIDRIEQDCKNNKIILTGFVKQEDIPLYFKSCDLVVFPYRTLMSASGPLSIAFSFKKPFIASLALSEMLETSDLKLALKQLNLDKNELMFGNFKEFEDKVNHIRNDEGLRKKLEELSLNLAQKRSWTEIGHEYYHEIFSK